MENIQAYCKIQQFLQFVYDALHPKDLLFSTALPAFPREENASGREEKRVSLPLAF